MTSNEAKTLIKQAFIDLLEKKGADEKTCEKYFSKQYTQYVDGKVLNFDEFVKHMKMLMMTIKSAKVDFKHIIAEGDKVATVHQVDAIKENGEHVKVQVNAMMQILDGKIVLCDELTFLIHGDKSDHDLGSRY